MEQIGNVYKDGADHGRHGPGWGYLARLLLQRATQSWHQAALLSFNTARVGYLYVDPHQTGTRFFMHYGDLTTRPTHPPDTGARPMKSTPCRPSHVQ